MAGKKKIGIGSKVNKLLNPLAKDSTMLERLNAIGIDATLIPLAASLFKDGGRVRGCGIAKRGFGKAMKRKK
tara:strand:- start:216 stop:431 length:216 start_codon:yes stop_codon:yes gene_type:complete